MPNTRFDESTKAKAVRLVREHAGDYDSEWAAMCAISSRLGILKRAPQCHAWSRVAATGEEAAARSPGMGCHEVRPALDCRCTRLRAVFASDLDTGTCLMRAQSSPRRGSSWSAGTSQ